MDALVSMAQEFTGLPMDSLIGGPLNAAATANSAMALTQTKFLMDTCFTKDATSGNYSPIMVQMSITRGVITPAPASTGTGSGATTDTPVAPIIESVTTQFNLPLLTIVPLNSLAVQTVDVSFEMEVNSSYSENTSTSTSSETSGEATFEAKMGWGPLSVTITGKASYDSKDAATHDTHYQKSNSAKYTVNVHAGQLPLPQGVNTIIQAYTNAIQPIQMPAQTPSSNNPNGTNPQ